MKVKIVKCKVSSFWYASEIGKVYDVVGYSSFCYKLIDKHWYIDKGDCEIVEDKFIATYAEGCIDTGFLTKEEMIDYLKCYGKDNTKVYKLEEVPIIKKVEWSIGE